MASRWHDILPGNVHSNLDKLLFLCVFVRAKEALSLLLALHSETEG